MGENLAVDDRLAVRTPMQWTGDADGRVLDGPARRAVPPAAHRGRLPRRRRRQRRDASAPTPSSLLNWFERIIRLRKELPEIGWGRCTVLDGGAPSTLVLRHDWQGRCVVTAHNLAKRAATARVDARRRPGDRVARPPPTRRPDPRQGWARPHPADGPRPPLVPPDRHPDPSGVGALRPGDVDAQPEVVAGVDVRCALRGRRRTPTAPGRHVLGAGTGRRRRRSRSACAARSSSSSSSFDRQSWVAPRPSPATRQASW